MQLSPPELDRTIARTGCGLEYEGARGRQAAYAHLAQAARHIQDVGPEIGQAEDWFTGETGVYQASKLICESVLIPARHSFGTGVGHEMRRVFPSAIMAAYVNAVCESTRCRTEWPIERILADE
jgi:hypothetical protein